MEVFMVFILKDYFCKSPRNILIPEYLVFHRVWFWREGDRGTVWSRNGIWEVEALLLWARVVKGTQDDSLGWMC